MNMKSNGHERGGKQIPVIATYTVRHGKACNVVHRLILRSVKPIGALEHWLATIGAVPCAR